MAAIALNETVLVPGGRTAASYRYFPKPRRPTCGR